MPAWHHVTFGKKGRVWWENSPLLIDHSHYYSPRKVQPKHQSFRLSESISTNDQAIINNLVLGLMGKPAIWRQFFDLFYWLVPLTNMCFDASWSLTITKTGFGPVLLRFIRILQQGDFRVSAAENAALLVNRKPRHVAENPTFHLLQSPLNAVCWQAQREEGGRASSRAERGKAPTAMNKAERGELGRGWR